MEGILIGLENWSVADYFRNARWGYALLNATHIFGVALLVGATVPMNLRLLGWWASIPRANVIRVLVPVAATGLVLAILAGVLLFSVGAQEYADLEIFQVKIVLVVVGSISAVFLHWRFGLIMEELTNGRQISHALISLLCWPGALVLGRLIAFAGD